MESSGAVERILGNPSEFFRIQEQRLRAMGIDIMGYALSHLAFRTETNEEYVKVRGELERCAVSNVENIWNGRRISKIILSEPLRPVPDVEVSMIELIPPTHQRTYKMGLEHLGVVIGEELEAFAGAHRKNMTGRQNQGPYCRPYYITFPDHTNVKFYVHSLHDVCVLEGRTFDGFHHVPD
ncbi:VOC family protein [Streptomyces sp. NPDC051776]|uniref:VOC family protein n=1 Tax=Streptomyces sp. NPDC051776 TaxID=3155414 RepID=UPI00344852BF